MTETASVTVDQIKAQINQLTLQQKKEILKVLEQEIYAERLTSFIENHKKVPISFEEITQEVEFVRSQRYRESRD